MAHYDVANGFTTKVQAARACLWYRLDDVLEVIDGLRVHNLDTVEGRNDAIAHFDSIQGVRGRNLVNMNNPGVRFPNGWNDVYITEYAKEFARLWTMIRRQLTYRETAMAKDSQAGRQQGAPAVGVTSEATTQSSQDNKKAISELIVAIKEFASKDENLWDMAKVEHQLGLTWRAAPAAAAAGAAP